LDGCCFWWVAGFDDFVFRASFDIWGDIISGRDSGDGKLLDGDWDWKFVMLNSFEGKARG
jgi:hypothetical protein